MPFAVSFEQPFKPAAALTARVFFTIGAVRSRWLLISWGRTGLSTLVVGLAAAPGYPFRAGMGPMAGTQAPERQSKAANVREAVIP